MCGIVGIIDFREQRSVNKDLLSEMNESQFHRGPDQGGLHLEPGVGLGHRRLSIIDLSGGEQPLFNEDNTVVVVYNGEIYNFKELSSELSKLGHQFKTHCDTEVIVHAWEEWGEACVNYFRGMFAFSIWDRNTKKLFLARDRLGIKPLFYSELPSGYFIFSSELKALMVHPDLPKDIDPQAVEDYFSYGYIPEPKTILTGVKKLNPGHSLLIEVENPRFEQKQYWDIPFEQNTSLTEKDATVEMIERLEEAVDIRLVSEVPLGAFLSGGVDSSAVVSAMAKLSPDPINTCSISFGNPEFNEAKFADKIAKLFNTKHEVEQVESDDFGLIDKLSGMYDEPYADSSAIPTYRVCELARKKVTVALSGDGGDENLAGYRRYRWHLYEERLRGYMPLSIRKPLFGVLGHVYPKADWAPKVFRAKATFESLARDYVEGYFHSVSILGDALRRRLFTKKFQINLQGYNASEVLRTHAANSPTDHPLSRIQYMDMKTYLVGDILTKVDRASMANSLEVRVPILDHKLVEWMSSLPPEWKLKGREGKYIFKKGLERSLPKDILYRSKMGFAVPLASWFRGPLASHVRQVLLSDRLSDTGIFQTKFLREIVEKHQSGMRDYSAPIWTVLMFDLFYRRVLGEN